MRTSKPSAVICRCSARFAAAVFLLAACRAHAQQTPQQDLPQQIQQLRDDMMRTQAQLEESQRALNEMRRQLANLQQQVAQGQATSAPAASTPERDVAALNASIDDLRERQAIVESQLATHDQIKVESESKYPVRITGMMLFNSFVNTSQVDMPATPTVAVGGYGSTGASVRQTILGFDAHGPNLFGARSAADLRVDFSGSTDSTAQGTGYSEPYGGNGMLLRLRTAHAALEWQHTQAFFALDRPIISPDSPTSLTAVAIPALAWSGNLWTWNPQLGITQDIPAGAARTIRLQGALIDVGDAPVQSASLPASSANTSEQSRWPGVEMHTALLGVGPDEIRTHFGAGGYFAPHRTGFGYTFDSWAATLDGRLRLPARLALSASAYRGLALGGLGGGAYKDFVYRFDTDSARFYYKQLDDVGGWAQLKASLSSRVELNAASGFDEVFAGELRRYAITGGTQALNLARNRTFTGNIVYSPSVYLLFSLEYRRLLSAPVLGPAAASNIIGIAAGYKF